jgi:hypothetical protein
MEVLLNFMILSTFDDMFCYYTYTKLFPYQKLN